MTVTTAAKHDDDKAHAHAPVHAKGKAAKAAPEKPVFIHPEPHLPGIKHKPGEDPQDIRDARADAVVKGRADDDDSPLPVVDESFTDARAQELYGLRKQGRIFRCEQQGLPVCLVECDTEDQARDAYCTEIEAIEKRRENAKGKKGEKPAPPTTGPLTLPAGLPAGTTITVGGGELPALHRESVQVVKLTA